jgi:hypothetical protein
MIVVGLVDFTRLEAMDRFRGGRLAGFNRFSAVSAEFTALPRPIGSQAAG